MNPMNPEETEKTMLKVEQEKSVLDKVVEGVSPKLKRAVIGAAIFTSCFAADMLNSNEGQAFEAGERVELYRRAAGIFTTIIKEGSRTRRESIKRETRLAERQVRANRDVMREGIRTKNPQNRNISYDMGAHGGPTGVNIEQTQREVQQRQALEAENARLRAEIENLRLQREMENLKK